MTVLTDRLAEIEGVKLLSGKHSSLEEGACVMELVAYVAGEPWSDAPRCASPVLTVFCVSWNDAMNDEDRQQLAPFIPRLVGTRTGAKDETIRAWMATDWLVRVATPAWLRLAKCETEAAALEALDELRDTKSAKAAQPALMLAKQKADAAWDAAWAAAWAAAAAWDAAWAAAAAWDAAWDAAWAAARDAAWAALRPTVVALQTSACELLDRMIRVGAAGSAGSAQGRSEPPSTAERDS